MNFFEAVKAGSELRLQGFSGGFLYGRSCAFDAAAEGLGFIPPDCTKQDDYDHLESESVANNVVLFVVRKFPLLMKIECNCPVMKCLFCNDGNGEHKPYLCDLIWHLNDGHKWNRYDIGHFIQGKLDEYRIT